MSVPAGIKSYKVHKRTLPGEFLLARFDESADGRRTVVSVRPELEKFRDGIVMREVERVDPRIRTRNAEGKVESRVEKLIQVCDGWSVNHSEEATPQDLQLYEGAQDDEQPMYAVLVRDVDNNSQLLDSYTAYPVDEAWTFQKLNTVKRQTAEDAEEEFNQMRAAGPRKSRISDDVRRRMQAMDSVSEAHPLMTEASSDAVPMNDDGLNEADDAVGGRRGVRSGGGGTAKGSSAVAGAAAGRPLTAAGDGIATAALNRGKLGGQALKEAQAGRDLEDEEAADERRERMEARLGAGNEEELSGTGRFGATSFGGVVDLDLAEQFEDDEGVDADLAAAEFQALGHEIAREDELVMSAASGGGGEGDAGEGTALLGGEEELTDEAADAALRARTLGHGSSSSRYGGNKGAGAPVSALGVVAASTQKDGAGASSSAAGAADSVSRQGSRKRGLPEESANEDRPAKRARGGVSKGDESAAASTAGIVRASILDLLERSGGRASKKTMTRLQKQLGKKHGARVKDMFGTLVGRIAKREVVGSDVYYVQLQQTK